MKTVWRHQIEWRQTNCRLQSCLVRLFLKVRRKMKRSTICRRLTTSMRPTTTWAAATMRITTTALTGKIILGPYSRRSQLTLNRKWLLPSFLLDVFWLTGIDKPVLFWKVCCFALQATKQENLSLKTHPYQWVAIIYSPSTNPFPSPNQSVEILPHNFFACFLLLKLCYMF